jgi:hypothetical protein
MTSLNNTILDLIVKHKNDKNISIIKQLKTKIKSTFNSVSNEELLELYKSCVSVFQTNHVNSGIHFEKIISTFLEDNNINFKEQVTIDEKGKITYFRSCNNIENKIKKGKNGICTIDIVVGDNIEIGKNIQDYIVISCKINARERWKQDHWSLKNIPKKFLLVVQDNDYPLSNLFLESETRKIITCNPKKRDGRKFKLNYDHFIQELTTK